MTEILALLQNIAPQLSKTTLRQMSQVIFGMLVSSGRITMLGLSRWADKDVRSMDEKYLKATTVKNNLRTKIYQGTFYNKEFAFALNGHPLENQLAHQRLVLFSTDLQQDYEKIVKFYSLRFQIEFNFRDAKQYWGLEDFMNIKETAVTNAANLSLFMVNFSQALLRSHRKNAPDFSVLDLKSYYRYASETINMLPQKPEPNLLADIFQKIARLGAIHSISTPVETA